MGDVLNFIPRPKPAAPEALKPLAGADLRASLEEAAQTAFDAADSIIAVLDRLDGDADHEDGRDDEPSRAAPENATGSQVTWLCGNDQDREEAVPEVALPEMVAEPLPEAQILPWRGRGNVIAAAGTMLLELLERAQNPRSKLRLLTKSDRCDRGRKQLKHRSGNIPTRCHGEIQAVRCACL